MVAWNCPILRTGHTTADKTATPLYHLSRVRQVSPARACWRTTILRWTALQPPSP